MSSFSLIFGKNFFSIRLAYIFLHCLLKLPLKCLKGHIWIQINVYRILSVHTWTAKYLTSNWIWLTMGDLRLGWLQKELWKDFCWYMESKLAFSLLQEQPWTAQSGSGDPRNRVVEDDSSCQVLSSPFFSINYSIQKIHHIHMCIYINFIITHWVYQWNPIMKTHKTNKQTLAVTANSQLIIWLSPLFYLQSNR